MPRPTTDRVPARSAGVSRATLGDDRSDPAGAHSPPPTEPPPTQPKPPRPPIPRTRLLGVDLLVAATSLLLVVAMFSIWANRLLFNPDNWSKTSTELLQNPAIRGTTANYLVDQLYANVDVAALIQSGLPPRLEPLAAPAAGALRNAAVQVVDSALSRPRVQNLWAQANRAADQAFIVVVNGGRGGVGIQGGVVTLNLGAILDDVSSRLGLPSDLSAKLPTDVASVTVLKSQQLSLVQSVGRAIQGLALWLTIFVPLLYGLAILLAAGHRRRTLMTVGFAAALAGVLVLFGRSILESQITSSLTSDASLRPTIRATIAIATGMLSDVAGACVLVGLVAAAAAWFAGPARIARASREAVAPFLREHHGASHAIALAVMAIVFIWNPIPATGTPAGIITFTALALLGTEILIRQTAREFPQARAGAATHAMRMKLAALRGTRLTNRTPEAPQPAGTAEQLQQLAELQRSGAITADEFRTAKAKVLHE